MKIAGANVLLTGASGGIGEAVCQRLLREGARVVAVGRSESRLNGLLRHPSPGGGLSIVMADITTGAGRRKICDAVAKLMPEINALVNAAGVNRFGALPTTDEEDIERIIHTNLTAVILLTRSLLPSLLKNPSVIVNVGSTFDSIGFPGFAAYCAGKFGLRGFNEALRRELAGTLVSVCMVSPRATDTPINHKAVRDMNKALKVKTDTAEETARAIVESLRREKPGNYTGWPEKFHAALNRLFPSVVDKAVARQMPVIRRFIGQ